MSFCCSLKNAAALTVSEVQISFAPWGVGIPAVGLKPSKGRASGRLSIEACLTARSWPSSPSIRERAGRHHWAKKATAKEGLDASLETTGRELGPTTNQKEHGEDHPLESCLGELGLQTSILQFSNDFDPYGAMSTPLYQTATFKQVSATEMGPYDYTRSGNPTRDAFERLIAKVEGATKAFAFTTGMSALATVTHLLSPGQEIVAGDDIYGGSDRLLSRIVAQMGITVKRVDTSDLAAVRAAIGPATRLVLMESPTNPRQQVSDIRAIADLAHAHKALLCVDNSIMSPVLSKPLDLGADIVMHSATKFIAGHSDVMAGVLAVSDDSLAQELAFLQNAQGTGLAPFDCWLCLRGVKTLPLRVEKQQQNAEKVAHFLASHPRITRVNYAGLPSHPGHDLHMRQAKGGGSVLSFATGSVATSKHIVEATKLFAVTVSFGSVNSLINLPCFSSHASIPAEVRKERGLTEDLVRISVGVEDVEDLIADLEQALRSAPTS